MSTSITISKFKKLDSNELYNILKARSQIFVVEQKCAYQDIDGLDDQCWHVQYSSNKQALMAYCRVLPPSCTHNDLLAIGRVLVLSKFRRQGLARQLMLFAIHFCRTNYPNQSIFISAQTYLLKFYQSLGFQEFDKPYYEDGIEHIDMMLK